ncbi:hypothetical protein EDD22DRAFT_972476 [Suillus occidentalis]|nr:hypothetical protein EDD22DRAFT_972476 [Suillus occidentalis]
MPPKSTQKDKCPIPGPSQQGQYPYPYPQMLQPPSVPSHLGPYSLDPYMHPYTQFALAAHPVYGALYPFTLPQHWGGYYHASQGVGVPLAPAQPSYPSTPSSVQSFYYQHPAQGPGQQAPLLPSYPAASQYHGQGLGQQAPAPPSYPSASASVPPYNQHDQEGLGQQTPVVAVKESAVKRGKRKAVDLDDALPPKKQAIQPLDDDTNFGRILINGKVHYTCLMLLCKNVPAVRLVVLQGYVESRQHQNGRAQSPSPNCDTTVCHGDSSNIGGSSSKAQEEAVVQVLYEGSNKGGSSSKTQEEAVVQVPHEGSNISGSSSKVQEEAVDQVPHEASKTPSEFFLDSFEDSDCTSSEPLEEPVNSLEQTKLAYNEQLLKFSDIDKAADVASGQQLEVVNIPQETDNSASGERSQEPVNSPDKTGDLAVD